MPRQRTDEIKMLLASIQAVYPHFMDGRDMEQTVRIWDQYFNEPYETISSAIAAFVSSDVRGFYPSIGAIKDLILRMNDTEPDELQAWDLVYRALSNASRKTFATLPPLIQQCIGSPETFYNWSQEDVGSLNTVTKAAFLRTYRVRAEKQREYEKLPTYAKSSYTAIAPKETYKLPPPKPKKAWDGEAVPVPACVMNKMAELRKRIPTTEAEGTMKERANALMATISKGLKPKID